MPKQASDGRINQRHRTRKDLLAAAARLLRAGKSPDIDAVAAEAMVSRATAYRYFPSIDDLLVEAPLDGVMPEPDEIFAGDTSTDPVARIEKAEAAMHAMCYRNEMQLRAMLAASLGRAARQTADNGIPVRQNRRTALIEAALAPARGRFDNSTYRTLVAALAMVLGTESMIVFADVLRLDAKTARRTKSWAARALVEAALKQSDERR